ncbi:aldehyde dehydrogenase [Asanoa sp. NPDC049518]|uniref:aldehyde dehydrogenase family protein n=1 Tax=unclassified Asanoa TaxID=2685164 RepID=UPI00342DC142
MYAHKAGAALAAGNAVIVQPPRRCPLALHRIAEIIQEQGIPEHAHQLVNGGPEISQGLAEKEGIAAVSLTGSTRAGKEVASRASRTLKKVLLELGGNDAQIVCADADVEKAAEAVVLGRLARGNGQICCAVKRVYVQRQVHDEFVDALVAQASKLTVGDQLDERTDVGPLIAKGSEWVAKMNVPDHTGGVILRPSQQLPEAYRVEYKLKTIDFGGKRNGTINYGGRVNGYATTGCKTQHPWGEGSDSPGWTGDASVPYCEWQDVRAGNYGYNGFHFMSIVDFANPAPRNNHFWHYRRKVLMDSFSQHPDRVGSGIGGRVCDSNTNTYYNYRDSNFNTVNMWISGMPNWNPGRGGLAGNSQWFMTSCSGGVAEQQLSSAAELQPELMPNTFYTFAIERDATGYVLEASGNFARVGQKTLRFHRPFVVNTPGPTSGRPGPRTRTGS